MEMGIGDGDGDGDGSIQRQEDIDGPVSVAGSRGDTMPLVNGDSKV